MLIPWYSQAVRFTGRWSWLDQKEAENKPLFTTTTTPGAYFELAFHGRELLLKFDLGFLGQPFPHLWICIDGGVRTEVPVDRYLRVDAVSEGNHVICVSYKGGMEALPRWYGQVMGAISFIGGEAQKEGILPADDRRKIEFLGDSITEGVLIDNDYSPVPANRIDQFNRPYQDDYAATYAFLTAEKMNLRPFFQAYGAVGLTKGGWGGVPRAGLIYPYVFDGTPYSGEKPDIVVINHGANDRTSDAESYIRRYQELVEEVLMKVPQAIIVCLSAFCGAFDEELHSFVTQWNEQHKKKLHFVSSKGWVPLEPLHPLREGHKKIAEKFIPRLASILRQEGITI